MMKQRVLVTKDMFGVEVWTDGADVEFVTPHKLIGDKSKLPGQARWLPNFWPSGKKRILSSKKVKKFFPELVDSMADGESKVMEITMTEVTY